MSLGKFIADRRKKLHMTQEELAARINVSKSAVAKWETDGGIPDRDNLKNLASVINVSVDDMHRIMQGVDSKDEKMDINITMEVITLLESYGYKVIRPKTQGGTKHGNKHNGG